MNTMAHIYKIPRLLIEFWFSFGCLISLVSLTHTSIYNLDPDGRHLSSRVVHTRYGTLRGFISTLSNRQLQPVEVFLGVPYAGAPIGALRFMPPVTSPHWKGVRVADGFGPVCPQKLPDVSNKTESLKKMPLGRYLYLRRLMPYLVSNQSEDCLYLNIYAPAVVGREPLRLPVMVFIHGESYEWNAGNPYDGRVLSSFGNVVVVTINYRLGILGFLPAVDGSARGNYGLMDQVAALHWIQDNIAEFGGDPNNVTVFGQGHGAACINLLMLSPMARGLFHRAIMQSGSALCPWAIAKDAVSHTHKMAKILECPSHDSTALIECLRRRHLKDILNVNLPVPDYLSGFGPTVDGIVLPLDPAYLMEVKPDLFVRYDLMFGVTHLESYFGFSAAEEMSGISASRRDRVLRTLVRNLFNYHLQEIFLTVVNEYMDWSLPIQRPTDILDGTAEAIGDVTVVTPLIRTGTLHSDPTFPPEHPIHSMPTALLPHKRTFFYVFGHQTEWGDYTPRLGSITGEDLAFVFGAPMVATLAHFASNYTRAEVTLAEMTMAHWTNFAKFGDPNIETQFSDLQTDGVRGRYERVVWPEFDKLQQKYLSISMKSRVKDHYRAHRLSYWTHLIPRLDISDPNNTSPRHHLLDNHFDHKSYDGSIRYTAKDAQLEAKYGKLDKGSTKNATFSNGTKSEIGNSSRSGNTTELHVFGLDRGVHISALGVTIAVGCSLLMLNVVVFAAIYYQKDKRNVERNLKKTFYQVERPDSDEDHPSYKKPYLLKDAPSSLILHHFEPPQEYRDKQQLDFVEISDFKKLPSPSKDSSPADHTHSTDSPDTPPLSRTLCGREGQPLLLDESANSIGSSDSSCCKSGTVLGYLGQEPSHPLQSLESETEGHS